MALPSSDPATWSTASVAPDHSGLDSLDDVLREVAAVELGKALPERPPRGLVNLVARVARAGIDQGLGSGMLHDEDSVMFTRGFLERLARIIAEIIDAPNALLQAQCVDIVFGLGIQLGVSQTVVASQHRMTKGNVSKICVEMRQRYKVPPSRGMKSIEACESYKVRQIGRRAKPAREAWGYGASLKLAIYGLQ